MSEDQDEAQKTEEPTPKKLEESRKKGQIALSREVNNWVMIFMGTVLIGTMGKFILGSLSDILRVYIERAHDFPSVPGGLHIAMGGAFKEVMMVMALPLMLLMIGAFLSPFVQVGPLFAPESIKPDFKKVSIIKGFGRLFSMRSIVEFLKGIFKIAIVGVVGVIILYPYYDKLEHTIGLPVPLLLDELMALVMKLLIGILVVLLVIAGIDLVYQRYEHYKKMRMTKQEVKDEYKQTEGDPHVKGKLRQLRAEKGRQRMIQAVPEADVVVTNPTHFSIALKYDPEEMAAPVCIAKGIDEMALRIREMAKEHDIMLYEDKPLARVLYDTVEIDEIVPPEHYKAVAEVISFVFQAKGRKT